jgi:uncharacterized protein (DUF305 family)
MLRTIDRLTRLCVLAGSVALGVSSEPVLAQTSKGRAANDKIDDATFVRMLIQHHEGGIEMARLEERRGASAEIRALATSMRRAQEQELADLRKHASQATAGTSGSESAKGAPLAMEAHAGQMAQRLKQSKGAALDREFIEHMLMHHEMTLQIVEHTIFKDKQLEATAQQIAAARKKDVAELESHTGAAKRD